MDDLIIMRDKIPQYNNCTSSYQRMVVYLGSVLDDMMIQQGGAGDGGGVADVHSSHSGRKREEAEYASP